MESGKRRIGIYGGTFNPVHNGHLAAVKSFLQSGKIDSLWVLLNPAPPHKPDEEFAPYSVRLTMLKEVFRFNHKVKVSDLEDHLPTPGYTIQTLRYLTSSYPEYNFYLCLGFDSFIKFQHWFKWEEILELCSLLVVNRPNYKKKKPSKKVLSHAEFVAHQPVKVSSSEIRKMIAAGKAVDKLIPPVALTFIEDHNLYK